MGDLKSGLFRPFGFLAPKDFSIIWLSDLLTMSILNEGYFKNMSYIQIDIYIFINKNGITCY
jgi:hypothetical protein